MIDKKLPRWDLTSIFTSTSGDDYKAALASVPESAERLKEQIAAKAPLKDILSTYERLSATITTLSAYTSALMSTDTSNSVYLKAVNEVEGLSVTAAEAENLFASCVKERIGEADEPALSGYAYLLRHTAEDAEKRMSLAEETLAADLARSGWLAFSRLFDTVTSSIADEGRTLVELRGDAYSHDAEVRRTSYAREKKILEANKEPLAAALNGIKGTCLTMEARQGWASPIERSAFQSRISMKTLQALIGALEDNLPMFRGYFLAKAKILGEEKLPWRDLFAPLDLGPSSGKEYSFEDAKEIVTSCFASFSPDMAAFAKKAFESNWIDAEPRKGKVGGAYDTSFPLRGESRVFCNFTFDYGSVSTLAHELGHAYHDSVVMPKGALLADYPMTLAETASIFAEQVVFQSMLAKADEREAVQLTETFVSDAAQVCVDILSRYRFEEMLFAERAEGDVPASRLSELMAKAQEMTYGDAVSDKHELMWAVKGHYYDADFSFYNYPYAFGQLFALGLFARSSKDPSFAKSYRELLGVTGSLPAEEVAAKAGCDITTKAFWQEGLDVIAGHARRIRDFADKM